MSAPYVLDACALVAFMSKETGWAHVQSVLVRAHNGLCTVHMHVLNLLEVYYDMYRSIGKEKAEEKHSMIKMLPIIFNANLSDDIFMEAGRYKAIYKISLADSVALAQAKAVGGILLTSDHHEFDAVEGKEPIQFMWIR